jgi:hypothetical protein
MNPGKLDPLERSFSCGQADIYLWGIVIHD